MRDDVARHPQVAPGRQLHAAGHAPALDGGDHRLGELQAGRAERPAVAQPGQVAEVGAGREGLLVAGEHGHARRVVGVEGQEARRAGAAAVSLLTALRTCALVDANDDDAVGQLADRSCSGPYLAPRYGRRGARHLRIGPGSAPGGSGGRRRRGPRPTACARPPSTPSAASAPSTEAAVLDLFAGQRRDGDRGAVREARRGRPSSTRDLHARRAIEANLATCGLSDAAEVVASPVERFLAGAQQRRWDLALLDPPYDYDGWPSCCSTCQRRWRCSSRAGRSIRPSAGRSCGPSATGAPTWSSPSASWSDGAWW